MVSFTISVYNELKELDRLLQSLKSAQNPDDEIVVLQTFRSEKEQSTENFQDIQKLARLYCTTYNTYHFKDKFSEMKNYLNSLATQDYIINLDADEFVSLDTINIWKRILTENSDNNDLFYIPRINTVEGYTLEDIKEYHWNINQNGWINWPDYQPRIFKNNGKIKWHGNVHEQLIGYEKSAGLPQDPRMAIIHHKEINKQRKQNKLYENIVR